MFLFIAFPRPAPISTGQLTTAISRLRALYPDLLLYSRYQHLVVELLAPENVRPTVTGVFIPTCQDHDGHHPARAPELLRLGAWAGSTLVTCKSLYISMMSPIARSFGPNKGSDLSPEEI